MSLHPESKFPEQKRWKLVSDYICTIKGLIYGIKQQDSEAEASLEGSPAKLRVLYTQINKLSKIFSPFFFSFLCCNLD